MWTDILLSLLSLLRGLLTGKFERGVSLDDPNSSRVAWVEAEQSRTNQSHPSLSKYADKEQFWQLQDTLKQIAEIHGKQELNALHPLLQINFNPLLILN